jgi:3-hydroxyacyl-[acyl-carrier-protein] dehydratase
MATLFKNDFYRINSLEASDDRKDLLASIRLNRDHPVFHGHFPDQPVVPGVLMIQLVAEILSEFLRLDIGITKMHSVKYLSFIDPDMHQKIDVRIEYKQEHLHSYKVNATVYSGEQVFMKCKALFQENLRKAD